MYVHHFMFTLRAPAWCSVLLDEVAPPREAPAMRSYLEEFMHRPSCVFQKPDVLRAVLGCLPFEDLQVGLLQGAFYCRLLVSGEPQMGASIVCCVSVLLSCLE